MVKKNECIECGKNTTNGIYILTGFGWVYEFYCISCARVYLSKLSTKSMRVLNSTELNQASREYDMILQKNVQLIKNAGFSMDEVPVEFKRNLRERMP